MKNENLNTGDFNTDIASRRDYLLNFALKRFVKQWDRANDLVNETILKALENKRHFAAGTNLTAWLFTIMRNTHFSATRRQKVYTRKEHLLDHASITLARGDDAAALSDIVAQLRVMPPHAAQALILIAAGMSYEEAAAAAGISTGTMKSRTSRARTLLASTPITPSLRPAPGDAVEEFHAMFNVMRTRRHMSKFRGSKAIPPTE